MQRWSFDPILALTAIKVDVLFEDEDGLPVTASFDPNNTDADFFTRIWSMDGVEAVDGSGTVGPASRADFRWLIVPAPGAGGAVPTGKLYFVGARIGYTRGGEAMESDVAPDYIYVRPLPLLTLDYFLTADDPFTEEIEPIEPFTLGVRVRNNGQGAATDVKIESAEPEIVKSEQRVGPFRARALKSAVLFALLLLKPLVRIASADGEGYPRIQAIMKDAGPWNLFHLEGGVRAYGQHLARLQAMHNRDQRPKGGNPGSCAARR